ncbi:PadR family transcriptional regulator [Neobacillus novalis]|uniref:PadR family transcriptional regulator n=1 Tax=Neobacillus novalis TaxID=220687 RepID=A0AA95MZ09_9BACI|nr:PadR family transcriptional regulator [Neobacillus novalis]WHY88758.1 PadR family transcriptional regulator [Neobacillus novalis]
MENKLRNLKQSMKNSVFKELVFTEKHQEVINRRTKQENVLEASLQLLSTEKTGIELVQLLRARNITRFEEQEGLIYTMLHQLEQDALLTSRWADQFKFYVLTQKGRKWLKKLEEKHSTEVPFLKKWIEGESS